MSELSITTMMNRIAGAPWMSRAVEGELVEGYFNGTNTLFRVASPPILDTEALVISDLAGVVTYTATSVNAETGAFTVTPAPAGPIVAAYTASFMPLSKLEWVCQQGLDEMESRWLRGYTWITNRGVLKLSASASLFTNPTTPTGDFADSRAQMAFLQACCELVLIKSMSQEAASNSIYYREERVGGLSVDATRRPRDWNVLLERALADVERREYQARSEVGNVEEFGYFLPGPRKVDGVWKEFGEAD